MSLADQWWNENFGMSAPTARYSGSGLGAGAYGTPQDGGGQYTSPGEGQGGQGPTGDSNVSGPGGSMTGSGTPGFGTATSLGGFLGNIATMAGLVAGPVGAALAAARGIGTMIAAPERDRFYGYNDLAKAVSHGFGFGPEIAKGPEMFGPTSPEISFGYGTKGEPADTKGLADFGKSDFSGVGEYGGPTTADSPESADGDAPGKWRGGLLGYAKGGLIDPIKPIKPPSTKDLIQGRYRNGSRSGLAMGNEAEKRYRPASQRQTSSIRSLNPTLR